MPKYKIYAILALLIMTVAFTIPTLGFFKVQGKIVSGQGLAAARILRTDMEFLYESIV